MLVYACLLGSNLIVHALPEKLRPSRHTVGLTFGIRTLLHAVSELITVLIAVLVSMICQ